MEESAALWKLVTRKDRRVGHQNTSWFSDPSEPRPLVACRVTAPASPLYLRASVTVREYNSFSAELEWYSCLNQGLQPRRGILRPPMAFQ
jgi:hypothetical protein